MTKKLKVALISALSIFLMASVVFLVGQNNKAIAEDLPPVITNYAKNLSFDDNVHIMYAIKTENLKDTDELGMLVWTSAPEEYVYGTQETTLKATIREVTGVEELLPVFSYPISAKQMTDTLYTVAYAKRGDDFYYAEPRKYSALEYAYNKLGKTEATPTTNENLKSLLEAMLEYGGASQIYFNYKTESLANAPHAYVRIENATFTDGYNYTIAKVGSKVEILINDGYKVSDNLSEYISVEDGKVFITIPANKTIDTSSIISSHEHENVVNFDKEKHWFTCSCGQVYGEEAHKGGTSTCTAKAICEICNIEYGEKSAHNYVDGLQCVCGAFNPEHFTDGLTLVEESGLSTYAVASYLGTESEVVIPTVYNEKPVSKILDSAFVGCNFLKSVKIGEEVTRIGKNAFNGCSLLESVQIPESVSSINYSAFKDCNSLEKVNYLGKIDNWAQINFDGNYANPLTYAKNLYINNELVTTATLTTATKVSSLAFNNCSSLVSVTFSDSVSDIEYQAFNNCASLKTVNVGNNVYSIGAEAFSNCAVLESVTLGNGVVNIGSYAFYNCSKIKAINLPETITNIGSSAFYNCSSLSNISIPNGVKTFGNNVFYGCSALQYTVENDLKYLGGSVNKYLYLADTTSKTITTATVNEKCKFIGSSAFQTCKALVNVELPRTIIAVGDDAFYNCTSLKEIVIPNRVRTIGNYAFTNCSALRSVSLSNRVESVGTQAFRECNSLSKIYYDGTIDEWAERGLVKGIYTTSQGYKKYDLYINDELVTHAKLTTAKSVSDKAFLGCASIECVTIDNSVTKIGSEAFGNCDLLIIYCEESEKPSGWDVDWKNGCNAQVVWDYKNGEVAQDGYIYATIDGIRYALKDGVATVTGQLQNITSAPISETVTYKGNTYAVTSIGVGAFAGCNLLTSVQIPNSVLTIDDNAFYNCTSLISVLLGNNVNEIGDFAFAYCSALTSVEIPESVTSIGANAFFTCTSLTSIVIPNNVTTVGDYAFYYCSSLESAVIGNRVTAIGVEAFYYCNLLQSVSLGNSLTSIDDSAFQGCGSLAEIVIPDSVINIGYNAFKDCSSLENVEIGNGVKNIGANTFYKCNALESLVMGNSIESIGEDAFKYCNALTQMNYLGKIDNWVEIEFNNYYSNPTALTYDLYINAQLVTSAVITTATRISAMSFVGCASLESVTINNSVKTIVSDSFSTCRLLIIYCEASSQPSGWESGWNCYDTPVVWNYKNNEVAENGNVYEIIDGIRYALKDGFATVTIQSRTLEFANIPNSVIHKDINYGVTRIGDYAFVLCNSLTSVTIPSSVTEIGDYAFALCDSLESIAIPDSVTALGVGVFTDCILLENVTIGKGITAISESAFAGCYSMVSLTIPNNVTSIENNAFDNCCLLKDVIIPNSVESIGAQAFANCSSLDKIVIPNSVKFVGDNAFENCISLEKVTIRKEVSNVGYDVFNNCDKLNEIHCEAERRPRDWKNDWIGRCSAKAVWGSSSVDYPTQDDWLIDAPGIGSYVRAEYKVEYY